MNSNATALDAETAKDVRAIAESMRHKLNEIENVLGGTPELAKVQVLIETSLWTRRC